MLYQRLAVGLDLLDWNFNTPVGDKKKGLPAYYYSLVLPPYRDCNFSLERKWKEGIEHGPHCLCLYGPQLWKLTIPSPVLSSFQQTLFLLKQLSFSSKRLFAIESFERGTRSLWPAATIRTSTFAMTEKDMAATPVGRESFQKSLRRRCGTFPLLYEENQRNRKKRNSLL